MSLLVVAVLFCHLTYTQCANEVTYVNNRHLLAGVQIPPEKKGDKDEKPEEKPKEAVEVKINSPTKVHPEPPDSKNKNTSQAPAKNATEGVEEHKIFKPEMESGALLRGVSVVVALTALVIIYLALKTYCRKKGRSPVMVNKYGVRGRRGDLEMTPLPLDEDDDDETLFEVHTTSR